MEDKLRQFLDKAFAPYGDFPSRSEVTKELLANLTEKYQDLKQQGMSDEEAYQTTVNSFGDVEEIMEQLPHSPKKLDTAATQDQASEPESEQNLHKALKNAFQQAKASMGFSKFGATVLQQADLADTD
jgi:Arc/MetJ-type ribon-helix-helix transcriptional regulator